MKPANSPRCYGLPTMFGADAAICGICAFHDDCSADAKQMLNELSQHMEVGNVGSMNVSNKKPVATKKAPTKVSTDSAKLTKVVNQILKAAPDFQQQFSSGENPFTVSTNPPYFKPCIDILLSNDSDKERLTRLLITVFNKTQPQAEKEVALFLSAIEYIKEQI